MRHFASRRSAAGLAPRRPQAICCVSTRGAPRPLGDLVICASVVRDEARQQHKTIKAHWAHLVIHGALHLLGYDHERDEEARRMERREVAVLKRFGITNPYRSLGV